MATFLYHCPTTSRKVQGWVAEDAAVEDARTFVPINCLACGATHLVNPKTGKTAGSGEKN